MKKEFLWVEKYRPKTISECILPDSLKTTFKSFVDTGEIPNMLLSGTAGLGKTTVAKALCKELNLTHILINGSEEGNIDTLRGKIKRFASSVSLTGGSKVVILDEADYLNAQSTQPALRGFIEEFSNNCRFILTCNFKNRIIEPLHSRCGVYEFNTSKKDMQALCAQMMQRVVHILEEEIDDWESNPEFMKGLSELILQYAPDWRRVINELQRSTLGKQDLKISTVHNSYDTLYESLKNKDFKKMRTWVANHQDIDASVIFRHVYDNMFSRVQENSIPQLVLIIADYQYKNAFVADHELNMVACMTEIMAGVEIK